MNIDLLSKMVKELILKQDELVLPQVGSFITEIIPASFSDKGYSINPPYRKLIFRQKDETKDSTLIDFYAKNNNIDRELAKEIMTNFLIEMKEHLYEKKVIILPELGRLRATKENNIFFIADEDLDIYPEGFGLESISLKTHKESIKDKFEDISELVRHDNTSNQKNDLLKEDTNESISLEKELIHNESLKEDNEEIKEKNQVDETDKKYNEETKAKFEEEDTYENTSLEKDLIHNESLKEDNEEIKEKNKVDESLKEDNEETNAKFEEEETYENTSHEKELIHNESLKEDNEEIKEKNKVDESVKKDNEETNAKFEEEETYENTSLEKDLIHNESLKEDNEEIKEKNKVDESLKEKSNILKNIIIVLIIVVTLCIIFFISYLILAKIYPELFYNEEQLKVLETIDYFKKN